VSIILLLPATTHAGSMRLCGQKLTKTLQAVCRDKLCGAFFENDIGKRKYHLYNNYIRLGDGMNNDLSSDLVNLNHLQFETTNMLKRNGIATQCCEHKCTYAYLRTFCCDHHHQYEQDENN